MWPAIRLELRQFWAVRSSWIFILLVGTCFIKQCIVYTDYVDSKEYLNAARNLLQHGDLFCSADYTPDNLDMTRRTLGYPLLILLTGFNAFFLLFIIQNAMLILGGVLLSLIGQNLFGTLASPRKIRSFVTVFLCLNPLLFIYAGNLIAEIPVLFLVTLLLYHRFVSRNSTYTCCCWLGLVLLKPAFVPALYLQIVFDLFLYFSNKKSVKSDLRNSRFYLLGGLKYCSVLVVIMLISFYNRHNTGVYHYSSIGVSNFYGFNARAVLLKEKGIRKADQAYEVYEKNFADYSFAEKYHKMQIFNKEVLKRYTGTYLFLHIKGSMVTLADPGRFDFSNFIAMPLSAGFMGLGPAANGEKNKVSVSAAEWIWMGLNLLFKALIAVLVVAGIIKSGKYFKDKMTLIFLLVTVCFFCAIAGPVGSARYLVPAIPALALLALAGFLHLFAPKNTEHESTVDQR